MEVRLATSYPLFDGLTRFLNEVGAAADGAAVSADVVEDENAYHFYFELPGVSPDSIDARVEEHRLVVEAERKRPEWPKDAAVHLAERRYGKATRVFALPEDAMDDGIEASYKGGVLEVTVPKRPEAKPVKIKINRSN